MDKQSVRTLVAGYSIETTVREGARIEKYQDLVPTGTSMYIPHVPGVAREDTVALAARLRKENMDPVTAWDKSIASINTLPIYIGLPGLAKASTLLKYALDCGVGPSLAAFSKHATQLSKLLTVSAPDEQVVALADYKAKNPQTRIQGLHFFPFGGLKRTTDWLKQLADGEFELT